MRARIKSVAEMRQVVRIHRRLDLNYVVGILSLISGLISLIGGLINLIGGLISPIGGLISHISVIISIISGLISKIRSDKKGQGVTDVIAKLQISTVQ